ncbi:MAG: TVP38/TMEM64 family protein [Anaerolineae bacterium]|nr:TVP38/TMEM64 family protein [Anaerolineae bacterium]
MSEEVATKQPKWLQMVLVIIVFGIFAATAWYYFSQYNRFNSENVQAFIRGFGAWAPVVFGVLYTISAPIPLISWVLSPLGGLLFGTFWGSLLVIGVATMSSLIPFTLSRVLGQEWVEARLQGKKLDDIYQRSEGQGGFLFILMMRLIPLLPWEVQNYVAGLTKVSVPVYIMATALGIIPGSLGLVLLGDAISDPTSWKFVAAIALNAVVMVGAPVVATLIRRRKRRQTKESRNQNE